jgi:hypothetical protein
MNEIDEIRLELLEMDEEFDQLSTTNRFGNKPIYPFAGKAKRLRNIAKKLRNSPGVTSGDDNSSGCDGCNCC